VAPVSAAHTPLEIRADDARRAFLAAQGLLGKAFGGRPVQRVEAMLRGVGAVQLDTISVLARSHELVAYARLGPVGREAVERAYWQRGHSFEYWAHAACVLPLEAWPWFALKRRRFRAGPKVGWPSRVGDEAARAAVLARLGELGPLTAADLGGARQGGEWWSWSPLKVAVEELLAEGEVVCLTRRGWRRVYDLAERALPAELLAQDPGDEECAAWLCSQAALRLGVGTLADIADYFRLRLDTARMGVAAADLVPVRVEGWAATAYVHPRSPLGLGVAVRGRHRTTLLSPFDSLTWYRDRARRVFGFKPPLELYVPAAKRVHGYFSMPLLVGGRLRGHVDPARVGRTLVARRAAVEPSAVEAMAEALAEAAEWVGCDAVGVEAVDPGEMRRPLQAALRRVA
jgi:uncharacterized protein